jgi:Mg/Co/Ni transporter MgtE
MPLAIDTTLEYLRVKLGLNASELQKYENKSIKEILDAEAAQGNQAAIQLAADMFTNPTRLIELFQLSDPNNKLIIMKQMTSQQLEKLLPMLEQDDLVQGLRYFTTDSLMKLLEKIPKEELVKTVFQLFSERQIIELMPEKQLDKLLTGVDMDKGLVLKNLKSIPEIYLRQMIESITGAEAKGTSAELINQISQFGDLDYKNALRNMDVEAKRKLTLLITSSDNKYYNNFDADAYTHIIAREREKEDVVKAMGVIRPEYLEKMLTQLPQDLLSVVTTQIDTEKFAHALIYKFPELLAKLIAS